MYRFNLKSVVANLISLTNKMVVKLECTVENQRFCLSNVSKDESKLCALLCSALMAYFNFLAVPFVFIRMYECNNIHCRTRSLIPEDDFF